MIRLSPATFPRLANRFSTSAKILQNRAIIYSENGSPPNVLSAITYPSLTSPGPNTLNIKYLIAPINPADINVIEGVYPAKPSATTLKQGHEQVFVGGNEGLAEITEVGTGVKGFERGEWVVIGKQQCGTWRSGANVEVGDVIKVPKGASEVGAATLTVSDLLWYS